MLYKQRQDCRLPQCPFWQYVQKNSITCEGLTDHSHLRLLFDTLADREQHREIFCSEHYRNCEVFRAIVEAKYAEEAL